MAVFKTSLYLPHRCRLIFPHRGLACSSVMDKWDGILQTASTCWDKLMELPGLSDHDSGSDSGVLLVPVLHLVLEARKV